MHCSPVLNSAVVDAWLKAVASTCSNSHIPQRLLMSQNLFAAGERAAGILYHPCAVLAGLEVGHWRIVSYVDFCIGVAWLTGASCCARFQWFDPARVYDLFPEIIAALNIFSLAFCVFLYVKVGVAITGLGRSYTHRAPCRLLSGIRR